MTAGQEALKRARWEEARAAFESALERERSPEALEGLATAHWWLDEIPRSLELREEVYRRYRERGDPRWAALRNAGLTGREIAELALRSAFARARLGRPARPPAARGGESHEPKTQGDAR